MGGTLGPKSFPWPTAIGNSPNANPLVAPQAPTANGPMTSAPTNGSATTGSSTDPGSPSLPGQAVSKKPLVGGPSNPVSLPQLPSFYR